MGGMAPHDLVDVRYETRRAELSRHGQAVARQVSAGRQRTLLTEAIVTSVIPYLATLDPASAVRPSVDADEIARFASMLLETRPAKAREEVLRLHNSGFGRDALYLDLFAPAARLLGQRWMDDTASFVEVTVGVGYLQEMLNELSISGGYREVETRAGRRVLLTTMPDEQHSFGLSMLGQFFVRAGWEVRSKPRIATPLLTSMVKAEWIDVLGISTGAEVRLPAVASAIRAVRQVSRNPMIKVLVGGAAFAADGDAVAKVGADATAADAREAVWQAECMSPGHTGA